MITQQQSSTARTYRDSRQVGGYGGVDYSGWSFEELMELAIQLRLRDAQTKSRRELLELFEGH